MSDVNRVRKRGDHREGIECRTAANSAADHEVLADNELRKLVVEITNCNGVEEFVRRMMNLHEALKAGRTEEVARIAGQSRSKSYKRLMSAVMEAVKEGRTLAATNTAFYASLYGYENSPEHVCKFMSYLSRFRQGCC